MEDPPVELKENSPRSVGHLPMCRGMGAMVELVSRWEDTEQGLKEFAISTGLSYTAAFQRLALDVYPKYCSDVVAARTAYHSKCSSRPFQ